MKKREEEEEAKKVILSKSECKKLSALASHHAFHLLDRD
jgi:hypothetical protein